MQIGLALGFTIVFGPPPPDGYSGRHDTGRVPVTVERETSEQNRKSKEIAREVERKRCLEREVSIDDESSIFYYSTTT